jgi:hypothetical protein
MGVVFKYFLKTYFHLFRLFGKNPNARFCQKRKHNILRRHKRGKTIGKEMLFIATQKYVKSESESIFFDSDTEKIDSNLSLSDSDLAVFDTDLGSSDS